MYLDALCKKYVAYECKNFHPDGLSNLVILSFIMIVKKISIFLI